MSQKQISRDVRNRLSNVIKLSVDYCKQEEQDDFKTNLEAEQII